MSMFRLIAAIDRQRGLAKQGVIPWYIPEDTLYYSRQTKSMGGVVLTGSATFQSYRRQPLPGRQNFVLTHDKTPIEGVELVHDLEKFLDEWRNSDVWVMGGANVFAQIMELGRADELYLTRIEATFGCTQFFPPYEDKFTLAEQSELHEQNGFVFSFTRHVATQK
jgi:dihydrofolate reductase